MKKKQHFGWVTKIVLKNQKKLKTQEIIETKKWNKKLKKCFMVMIIVTWWLYDWISPVGPIQWKCTIIVFYFTHNPKLTYNPKPSTDSKTAIVEYNKHNSVTILTTHMLQGIFWKKLNHTFTTNKNHIESRVSKMCGRAVVRPRKCLLTVCKILRFPCATKNLCTFKGFFFVIFHTY